MSTYTKAFDSIHRGKMEQILLAYGIPKETVAAITILYRNTKVKVRSPDGDTEYFDIVAGVLQGDTLAPYLFIICLDYELRTSIDKIRENVFELTKKRSRRYPAKTITDADYADDIAILANTPDQAETLLHSLERAAAGIGLYVNAYKTEYMCYNQKGDISTLDGTHFKLVNKFTYLGSSVESTEKDISVLPARHDDDDDIYSSSPYSIHVVHSACEFSSSFFVDLLLKCWHLFEKSRLYFLVLSTFTSTASSELSPAELV